MTALSNEAVGAGFMSNATSPAAHQAAPASITPASLEAQPGPTPASARFSTVSYTASAASFVNPERGFYHHHDCNVPLNVATLQSYRADEGVSLFMCVFYLRDFTTTDISQSALDFFQSQMDTLRDAGLKAIVRFAYSNTYPGVDASPSQIDIHLNQLAPYLAKNKDVIAVVQAGFVGAFGEWANSAHFGTMPNVTAKNLADRKAVADKILQAVPVERMVQLRTPQFKRNSVGSIALSHDEAFNGSAKARLGHHNDCFLASSTDYGTYGNPPAEYPYMAADTTYLPMGGETCNYAPTRSDCPTALTELQQFHWSYLNLDYNRSVLNKWRSQGCFDEIKRKLGYRFTLQRGRFSTSAQPGGTFTLSFTVQNQGWAAPYNRRDVELILRNTATGAPYHFKLNADPRFWLPGQTTSINQTVTLPAEMPKGNYAALLNLPDPMPTLHNRPEYSIQLANNNVWEAETGFNDLHHTFSITHKKTARIHHARMSDPE